MDGLLRASGQAPKRRSTRDIPFRQTVGSDMDTRGEARFEVEHRPEPLSQHDDRVRAQQRPANKALPPAGLTAVEAVVVASVQVTHDPLTTQRGEDNQGEVAIEAVGRLGNLEIDVHSPGQHRPGEARKDRGVLQYSTGGGRSSAIWIGIRHVE